MPKFKRILLIDDDEITNFINYSLLEQLHLASEIKILTDAEKALTYLHDECPENNCPDLILLDLKMPVFDGFDFLEALQKLPSEKIQKVKLVVLTTSNNPKDTQRLEKYGINSLINKPLTSEKISAVIV